MADYKRLRFSDIHLYKSDGTDVGALTYQPPKDFKPSEAVQYWLVVNTPQGEPIENSAYIKDEVNSISHWKLPAGITNSDGTDVVHAYVHLMNGSLQINTIAFSQTQGSLPEGYYFEFKLKSSGFAKKIKWVLSNVRDPEVSVAGDIITVKGLPENSPSANCWRSSLRTEFIESQIYPTKYRSKYDLLRCR
jgi:hypothetical protein